MTPENHAVRVMLKKGRHNCFLNYRPTAPKLSILKIERRQTFPFLSLGCPFFERTNAIFTKNFELLIMDTYGIVLDDEKTKKNHHIWEEEAHIQKSNQMFPYKTDLHQERAKHFKKFLTWQLKVMCNSWLDCRLEKKLLQKLKQLVKLDIECIWDDNVYRCCIF